MTWVDLNFGLDGKVAVITGGASGIGAAIAEAYAAKGASVVVLDLAVPSDDERGAKLGASSAAFKCDVTDEASVADVVAQIAERYGQIKSTSW
ncbi:SDR family NAD(P)-dependent oxidoreductase [Micromonospora sp. NPDC005163]